MILNSYSFCLWANGLHLGPLYIFCSFDTDLFCLMLLCTTVSIRFMTFMPETIREMIYGNQWVLLSSRDESMRSLVLAVEGLFQILYLQDMFYCCWVIWFQKTSHIFSQFLMYCSLLACRGLEHELKETQKMKKVKDLKKKKRKRQKLYYMNNSYFTIICSC